MNYLTLFAALLIIQISYGQKVKRTLNYLDQNPPKETPKIFAPGIVSLEDRFELGSSFSPDGKRFAFGVASETDPRETCIYMVEFEKGKWSTPSKDFLQDNVNTFYPIFSPDGKDLFFSKADENGENDFWKGKFVKRQLTDVKPLPRIINSKYREAGHGLTKGGSFYFTSNRDEKDHCCGDIYLAKANSREFKSVEKIAELNTKADEEGLFISPAEDYIIIQSWQGKFESMHDLYISFRRDDLGWTQPERLDKSINTKMLEQRPFVSPDNRFLFFSRMKVKRIGEKDIYSSDIYWVGTKKIFKPFLNKQPLDTTLELDRTFKYLLPKNMFKDIDDRKLSYNVQLKNGETLPRWLVFDEKEFSLKGTAKSAGKYKVVIAATDSKNNVTFAEFNLIIKNK